MTARERFVRGFRELEKRVDVCLCGPDDFFKGLMSAWGVPDEKSIQAMLDVSDLGSTSVSHDTGPDREWPDLAVKGCAYFRFFRSADDVAAGLEQLEKEEQADAPGNNYRLLACLGNPHATKGRGMVGLACRRGRRGPRSRSFFRLAELAEHMDTFWEYRPRTRLPGGRAPFEISSGRDFRELVKDIGRENGILRPFGGEGRDLCVFASRLLFCMIAQDTGIFPAWSFRKALLDRTDQDGSGAEEFFSSLFLVLDTPYEHRAELPETVYWRLKKFPYIGGGLFRGACFVPRFSGRTRRELARLAGLWWKAVSPEIFWAMLPVPPDSPFSWRNPGSPKTEFHPCGCEHDYMRVLSLLFLDGFNERLKKLPAPGSPGRLEGLRRLHRYIASAVVLDPACRTGNFLLFAYRELRRLELKIVKEETRADAAAVNLGDIPSWRLVSPSRLSGIEADRWQAALARMLMYVVSRLADIEAGKELGVDIPVSMLPAFDGITEGDGLAVPWEQALPASGRGFIVAKVPACADFGGWFRRAADCMDGNREIRTAFAAGGITGEGSFRDIWRPLMERGITINFCYGHTSWPDYDVPAGPCGISLAAVPRPRRNLYTSRGSGGDSVVGFSFCRDESARLYENHYDFEVTGLYYTTFNRGWALTPFMTIYPGGRPVPVKEAAAPLSAPSPARPFNRFFGERPKDFSIVVPRVIPAGFSRVTFFPIGEPGFGVNGNFMVTPADLYQLGVLSSAMHMAWLRITSPAMSGDFFFPTGREYSVELTYNTFIWPQAGEEERKRIGAIAAEMLELRRYYKSVDIDLDDMYDPMPLRLYRLHCRLDEAVDACYRKKPFADDCERAGFLLGLYRRRTAGLAGGKAARAP